MTYGYTKKVPFPFREAVEAIKMSLEKNGFGVLTTIDVQATMKKKIGAEYEQYLILGACNPHFAHKALSIEKEIGLLLPCNVIVYEENGEVHVSAILPSVAMSMVASDTIESIAREVEEKLKKSIDDIS